MAQPASNPQSIGQTAERLSAAALPVLASMGLVAGAGAIFVSDPAVALILKAVAATLACLLLLVMALTRLRARSRRETGASISRFIAHDASPSFTTDADGQIGFQNDAARERFGKRDGQTLVRALGDLFASPSAVLYRLQNRAMAVGAAREDVVTRRGHVRLSVHRIGADAFLWRFEEMVDRSASGRGAETLSLPMLTVTKTGTILFMNEALRALVGGRVRTLDRVFPYLPLRSGEETEISGKDGPVRVIAAEIEGASGRREIYLLPAPPGSVQTASGRADFDNLPVALLKIAPEGRLRAANQLARELLGLTGTDDPTDLDLGELVDGPGQTVGGWLQDAMAGRAENRPQTVRARRREETHLQVTLRRISEDGRPGLLAVLIDATELRTLQVQFTQSQKMQAVGQLAGGIAHDFNNLLTAISGHCDLLLLRHDSGNPDYADLVQINQNANRAASLVGQLLAFSRKQTLRAEVLDLRDTLAELAHLLNRLVGEKVSLRLTHDPELRPVRADRRQFEQVIMNLVVNARDAMPSGGSIAVETENTRLDQELHRDRATVPPGDYVVVRVRDEGHGIAEEQREKVFEPFFTTKRAGEGTGLGLSTAYGIVKQSGGFIFVDSALDAGTTFTILLPACDTAADAGIHQEVPVRQERAQPHQGVILLVEDEAPVRAFAARALRMRGYTVLEAETAEAALDLLQDPDLQIDLFLTDVVMPGMDGPSWVREARKSRPEAPVIFVSGYLDDMLLSKSGISNAVFLPKPFSLSELTDTVQRQIH